MRNFQIMGKSPWKLREEQTYLVTKPATSTPFLWVSVDIKNMQCLKTSNPISSRPTSFFLQIRNPKFLWNFRNSLWLCLDRFLTRDMTIIFCFRVVSDWVFFRSKKKIEIVFFYPNLKWRKISTSSPPPIMLVVVLVALRGGTRKLLPFRQK